MSRDPAAEARRWLRQAESDLSDARYLLEGKRFAVACFLCHQAAEKALKAVLYGSGADLVLGHGLARLCQEVAEVAPDSMPRCAEWSSLDLYYVPTRYPDALPEGGVPSETFTHTQATDAVGLAAEVVGFAADHLMV